ncbi:tripartite ATP-independent transporter solute receptor, DctP family [Aquiflexum balticum DSM 16537]|uniref:Tripartite ATP-independent transporter solute receptor, DctP family n=1 Tax=Aquiflexum balticum DSM 16537 TaxID=758820 RepID=A0A1W2H952_9BACT|nr:TRAP transporter substrate-binding protein [Aquiflexum balticum]SMD45242.1 tripartite ATP-independent transporter solute receptor, DctP family [Aquiflexum balticum DSM 16537]
MTKYRILIFLITVFLFSTCTGPGGVRQIKLGHGLGVTHPVHEAMVFMAKLVDEKSKGQMQIRIYPNQQLGTERELVELLQIGSLGMTKVSSATLESFAPKIQVLSMPYLFRDDEHRDKVLKGEIGKQLLSESEEFWLKGLVYYDAGKRSFYTKTKSVESPEDLKGLKVRTLESNMAINMIKSFGSSPTPVSYGELYTALQQGIVDGAENNPPSLYTSRHYEVCKFYSINEHTAVPDVVIVSTKVWNKLDDQEKQWIQEAADESAVYQYKLWAESVEESLREMEKAGVIITYPDQTPFREAVESLYETIKLTQPEMYEMVERIRRVE